MTPHCESECSAKTKLSTGSSSPAMATRTALRERKDMAFTTPPYTGEGRERRMGWEERQRRGQGRGDTVCRESKTEQEKAGERESRERNGWTKGMERLIAEWGVDVHKSWYWFPLWERTWIQTLPQDGHLLLEGSAQRMSTLILDQVPHPHRWFSSVHELPLQSPFDKISMYMSSSKLLHDAGSQFNEKWFWNIQHVRPTLLWVSPSVCDESITMVKLKLK